jgi:benzoate 4-monooxygenase
MALFDSPVGVLVGLCAAVLALHVVPWLVDPYGIRDVPGPFLAKFSDLWLGRVAALGHRSEVVHKLHAMYGPLVRIAPNHVSIADPTALQIVYAHGNGALKSNFYE